MNIEKAYLKSFNSNKLLKSKTAQILLKYYTKYETINIMKKYNIGVDKDGNNVYWFLNKKGHQYSMMTVNKKYFFKEPGIFNEHLIQNEKPEIICIVDNPNISLISNVYMRRFCFFTYVGPTTDWKMFENKNTFQITNGENEMYGLTVKQNLPNCNVYKYENFISELEKTGQPKQFYFEPNKKVPQTKLQLLEKAFKNEHLNTLMKNLGLEFC